MSLETIVAAVGCLFFAALIVWRACSTAPIGWQDADGWHAGEEPEWLGIGGGDDRFHDERSGL